MDCDDVDVGGSRSPSAMLILRGCAAIISSIALGDRDPPIEIV